MKAWTFSSVYCCIRSEKLYCCHLCCFLFLYLNMLSAASRAQYNDWATVGRSWVQIPLGATDLFSEASTGLRGIFPRGRGWWMRLRTHFHLMPTLRMCGAVPPIPLVACIWIMSVEIRESKLQEDRETCKVWNLTFKGRMLHICHAACIPWWPNVTC
jgi:hypothetical protein